METSTCLIPLSQGQSARVSPEDFEFLMQFSWCAVRQYTTAGRLRYYALRRQTKPVQKTIRLHQEIGRRMGIPAGVWVDHINSDGLDNTRENLRPATPRQSSENRRKHLNCSSRYKGVSWNKRMRKWTARICVNYKSHFLGAFDSELEAAAWYAAWAIFYNGEYACAEPA